MSVGVDPAAAWKAAHGGRPRPGRSALLLPAVSAPPVFHGFARVAGANLDEDQQILLGGDNGLRGYPLRYQAGDGRWLFTAEQRFFTQLVSIPAVQRGRRRVLRHGGDLGRDPLGSPSQGLLRDIGFGLRLGNGRSALGNVLHIDIAFPLDGDSSVAASIPH